MELLAEIRGAVALVTLNRPKAMNALSRRLRAEIGEIFLRLDQDPAVRAKELSFSGRFVGECPSRRVGSNA